MSPAILESSKMTNDSANVTIEPGYATTTSSGEQTLHNTMVTWIIIAMVSIKMINPKTKLIIRKV